MTETTATTTASLRTTLKADLPGRVEETLAAYASFAAQPAPDDAKAFAAHHAACKSALQHADLLLKLLRWADSDKAVGPEAGEGDRATLLARARAATSDEDGEEDGEEDDY